MSLFSAMKVRRALCKYFRSLSTIAMLCSCLLKQHDAKEGKDIFSHVAKDSNTVLDSQGFPKINIVGKKKRQCMSKGRIIP